MLVDALFAELNVRRLLLDAIRLANMIDPSLAKVPGVLFEWMEASVQSWERGEV